MEATSKPTVHEEDKPEALEASSLSEATLGTKKAERKWHSRASSIPKAVIVRWTLLSEAVKILEQVNSHYGIGDAYLDDVFGWRIEVEAGNRLLMGYLRSEGLEESIRFRACNDGFQIWYPCRTKFGMCASRCYEMLLSEEGLGTLNTYLSLKCKLLWKPALTYYTACMAQQMDTDELYSHLESYVLDPDLRRKIVLRAKRTHGLKPSKSTHFGCGWDQCYFIGAVKILRQLDNMDFILMHSGKLSLEDCERVGRLAKTSVLKLPSFVSTEDKAKAYYSALAEIKAANFL